MMLVYQTLEEETSLDFEVSIQFDSIYCHSTTSFLWRNMKLGCNYTILQPVCTCKFEKTSYVVSLLYINDFNDTGTTTGALFMTNDVCVIQIHACTKSCQCQWTKYGNVQCEVGKSLIYQVYWLSKLCVGVWVCTLCTHPTHSIRWLLMDSLRKDSGHLQSWYWCIDMVLQPYFCLSTWRVIIVNFYGNNDIRLCHVFTYLPQGRQLSVVGVCFPAPV